MAWRAEGGLAPCPAWANPKLAARPTPPPPPPPPPPARPSPPLPAATPPAPTPHPGHRRPKGALAER